MTVTLNPDTLSVSSHPFVKLALSQLRATHTGSAAFREALKRVLHILMQEATQQFPTHEVSVTTPLGVCHETAAQETQAVWLVPILRAGLTFLEPALDWIPWANVYPLGLYRDEETLEPVRYYEKFPKSVPDTEPAPLVYLLDPMLATGGSIVSAMEALLAIGVAEASIRVVSLMAAPEGVHRIQQAYPKAAIFLASLDQALTPQGYIYPGLGDAGDRAYQT
jgi:uracil phosphoribosyltransferase